MEELKLYVHEMIEAGDNILLETKLETEKVYIATVYERDLKKGYGIWSLTKVMGDVVAYFDEHPTMEDARPYWTIRYIVSPDYKKEAGVVMEKILGTLLLKKKISEPVWMHNVNKEKVKDGDIIRIKRGKIFPDDV